MSQQEPTKAYILQPDGDGSFAVRGPGTEVFTTARLTKAQAVHLAALINNEPPPLHEGSQESFAKRPCPTCKSPKGIRCRGGRTHRARRLITAKG